MTEPALDLFRQACGTAGPLRLAVERPGGSVVVRAAFERGYAYMAITDHSQALGITGGLTEDELREEHAQIRALQPDYPSMQLLCGVEVDIHIDERLDRLRRKARWLAVFSL